MSDLWDYDDDDDLDNGITWKAPSPDEVVVEVDDTSKKRKGGRKPGRTGKRRAVSPAAAMELRPVPMPTAILLDSDDEDDLVLMPSPDPGANRRGATLTADGVLRVEPPPAKAAVANLNPATQESLAKEQALLRALQEVTERAEQPDDDVDLSVMRSMSTLPHLAVSRLASRVPPRPLQASANLSGRPVEELSDDDVQLAAVMPATLRSVAASGAYRATEPASAYRDDAGAVSAAGAAPVPAADRVQLKLVWGRDKEECIKMRVVKTDPFFKMVEKFREIAKQRNLCRDANKIKFLFDGDDLAKMPNETPESMDMEDDMMIDVKL